MNRFLTAMAPLLTLVFPARATLSVVTSVPSLASLAKEVGGDHVSVVSLAGSLQDPHFVDGRPSFIVKLHDADLLAYVGAELEVGWLPSLVTNARNGGIQPGQPGNFDASSVVGGLQEVGAGVDRSQGDVHPNGNPHFLMDPRYGMRVAKALSERFALLDPAHAADYAAGWQRFAVGMRARVLAWEAAMSPFKGAAVVGFHQSIGYLTAWLGLKRAGFVEPLPGISPGPKHLAELIVLMRQRSARVIICEPWYDAETAQVVAEKAGATVVRLPGDVGSDGIPTYAAYFDHIVTSLIGALK